MPPEHRATHRRRSIRLKSYDYNQAGAYFVTICIQDRICLFGEIADDSMHLNGAGDMVLWSWESVQTQFSCVGIDAYVVMPNHIHGIIILPDVDASSVVPKLGQIVGAFKSASTVAYIRGVREQRWPEFRERLWQRNYYEHVIRNESDLNRIRRYVDENPLRWAFDNENPNRSVAP